MLSDQTAGAFTKSRAALGCSEQGPHGFCRLCGSGSDEQMFARLHAHPGGGLWACHDRKRHGHGFKQLVLNAPGDGKWHHGDRRMREIGPDVWHLARHQDALAVMQSPQGTHRIAADDGKADSLAVSFEPWQHLSREPERGLDVGPIVHGAREHEGGTAVLRIGVRIGLEGIKEAGLDTVCEHPDGVLGFRGKGAEFSKLPLGGNQNESSAIEKAELRLGHKPCFAFEERTPERIARARRKIPPLCRITVDEIGNDRNLERLRQDLGGSAGIEEDEINTAPKTLTNPPAQPSVGKGVQAQRATAHKARAKPAEQRRGRKRPQIHRSAELSEGALGCGKGRRLDVGRKLHLVAGCEMPQDMEGTDALALVWRPGSAMGKKEDAHGPQPSVRAMGGPISLVSGKGSRFQASMKSRRRGFDGLIAGTPATLRNL